MISEVEFAVLGLQNTYSNETFDWLDVTFKKRLVPVKEAQACYYSISPIVADLAFSSVINQKCRSYS